MTLDFTGQGGVLTIYRPEVATIPDRMILTGLYSNELILNGADLSGTDAFIPLSVATATERYLSFIWSFTNTKLQTEDIGGYYTVIFKSGSQRVPVLNELVKVKNAFVSDVAYVSPNEENEQYTLFR